MRVDIIETPKALTELRADWDAVYDADTEAQFFLSWDWMAKWLPGLGKPWLVLAARPDTAPSATVAVLPLWLQTSERKAGGFYNLLNMGGNYTADYTGFLCRPEFEEQAIPALARGVKQLNWTHLRLDDLRVSERRAALFMQEFPKTEFDVRKLHLIDENKIDNSICPLAQLPADWESYLEGNVSANMRQKLRRLLRQTENSREFRITHADRDSIERDLEILMRLWTERWGAQKGKRLDEILRNTRLMLRHCFATGALFLPVLWQGERPICALATIVDTRKRAFLFYLSGRDQAFDGPPPGLLLHAHSIRHAIRSGFTTYDFLRGNEPYKYSFGVEERRIASFVVSTKDGKNRGGKLDRRCLASVLRRSMAQHRAGRRAEAEQGYRQVLELEPRNADALYGLGQILQRRGDHAAAIETFKTLLAAHPDTLKAWFRLGRSLRARGQPAAAASAYCEGIARQPAIAGAYFDLGHILLELEQPDQAVAAFDVVRSLQADFPGIDASLTKALSLGDGWSPEQRARRAGLHAEVRASVGKLSAIAAAAERQRRAAAPVAARKHGDVEPA